MAAESTKSNGSAESYIGSFISLTSKSEIRYEGFLFHLNPAESTIGLRNVKSFGTEGRKKDGAQILPSDKVYDYIFFRGTDIKDLQVISSPPVQTTIAVPDDPAIIQSHYPQSTSWSSSAPPPTANGNGLVMPGYWPGSSGSSGGVPHLPEQSFVRPPQDFAIPPRLQQQMQYPSMNASLADNNIPKVPEFTLPVLPTLYSGFPNLPSTVSPPSALPSSLPIGQSTNATTDFSSVVLGSSSPLVLPLTPSSLGLNPTVPPIAERPLQSVLSIVGSSNTTRSETSIPPLVTPGQLLQPASKTPSSIHSLQFGHKDIEVVPATTSELPSPGSENAQEPGPHIPSPPAKKLNGGSLRSPHNNRHQAQGRESKLNGAAIHTHRVNRGRPQGRGNMLNGAALYTHHHHRGHARGRGNGLNGAALHSHYSDRRHSWGRENAPNGVALQARFSYSSQQRGRGAQIMPKMTKFTEDFDFEAMNEKFNKKEVWGQLGKSYESELDDKEGHKIDDGEDDEAGSPKSDLTPVYVKDDFFDSFSCNTLNHESGKGRPKLSEQRKMDAETFGEFRRNRRGRGSQGSGHGGQLRGSYHGRGHGYAGRGRGGPVWSRVT